MIRNNLLHYRALNTDVAALLLRLLFGGLFAYYGYTKLTAYDAMLAQFPDLIGIGSKASLILVILAELVCGLLVALGFFTRLAVIPIFITMVVAYFIAHAADPFTVKALAFVFLFLCVVVFVLGSGRYSIDRLLFKAGPKTH